MDYQPFCENLARDAGALMKANFTLGMKKEWKGDGTPVTATDKAINDMVLEAVHNEFPGHSVLAEEGSSIISGSEYTWVCDPLDGTRPFSHGLPLFVFALALVRQGVPLCGVLYDPILDRMYWAEKGKGAYMNGQKIAVSSARSFTHTIVAIETARGAYHFPMLRYALGKQEAHPYTLGSVLYGGALVACGELVAVIFTGAGAHDAAALKIIIDEAGGKMTDISGADQRYDQPINGYIASNGYLHQALLDLVASTMQKKE